MMKLVAFADRGSPETASLVTYSFTEDDIQIVIAAIVSASDGYMILSDPALGDETYLQATTSPQFGGMFIVERRDGCAGEHYRGERRIDATELFCMLVDYMHGDTKAINSIAWTRVNIARELGDWCANDNRPSA